MAQFPQEAAATTSAAFLVSELMTNITTTTSGPAPLLPCYMVNSLAKNTEEQCKFIIDNDCLEEEAAIDYVYMVYCEFGYEIRYAAIGLIVFLVVVLFLNLSAVAEEFLCPSLLAVAKSLKMSDSLAGVTLLAFGNACPDIFASLAAASSGRPEMIVGELLGAGIFCTSVVAGSVLVNSDFKLASRPLLRDTCFYLLAVYLVWLYCWNEQLTFYGSLALLIIYVIYLIVALAGQSIHSRLRGEYPLAETQNQSNMLATGGARDGSGPGCSESWFTWRGESLRQLRRLSKQAQLERRKSLESSSLVTPSLKSGIGSGGPVFFSNSENITVIHLGSEPSTPIADHTATGATPLELHLCSVVKTGAMADGSHTNKAFEEDFYHHQHHDKQPQITATRMTTTIAPATITTPTQPQTEKQSKYDNSQVIAKLAQQVPHSHSAASPALLSANYQACERADYTKLSIAEWEHFVAHVNPIDIENWHEINLIGKVFGVLRAPILFVTILTVPVVDREKDNNNWCRLLNTMHCILVPVAIVMSTKLGSTDESSSSSYMLFNCVPLKMLVLIPATLLALVVFRSSRPFEPPKYHAAFAYVGFMMSVLWVYTLATEIISVLKTFGIIFSMTDTAIGLGVLAWGNSLGDIVTNLSLAEAGYPRMALSASIGAPLLNLLLGFGLAFTVYLEPGQSTPIEYTPTITLLAATLGLILVTHLLSTLVPSHKSKRGFGFTLIAGYGVYFLLAVCIECGFITF